LPARDLVLISLARRGGAQIPAARNSILYMAGGPGHTHTFEHLGYWPRASSMQSALNVDRS
jgi:hypothetical protein